MSKKELIEKVKTLEKNQELLIKQIHDLNEIINKLWEESHPPVMGGN